MNCKPVGALFDEADVLEWGAALARLATLETKRSFVYFIGDPAVAIKIGTTQSVAMRLRYLQTGSPIPLRVLATHPGSEGIEQAYHSRFRDYRLHGEWFLPHPNILREIDRLQPHADSLSTNETTTRASST